ncbi:MAG: FHA domain-containing protein, partial [Myxococcota bacterium]|nr:FHA domain-containing protein [Myxococcota bacterium]
MSTTTDTVLAPGAPEAIRFQRYRFHGTSGLEHVFERRLIYVGAESDNDLVIDDPTVSRVHARLEFEGRGFLLRDLSSKNGTRINGVPIQEAYLESGVTVSFGTSEWRFVLESESVEVALARTRQLGDLVGESSQMREIFAMIERVAPRDLTVLVEGESGTGKELAARAIHQCSARASAP